MLLLIDLTNIKTPRNWTKFYDKVYRKYHRVKFLTLRQTQFGTVGIMISKQSVNMLIHVFVDGYYFKYPKQTSSYAELNQYIKHASTTWFNRVERKMVEMTEKPMFPFEFYNAMDKVLFELKTGKRDTNRVMKHYTFHPQKDKMIAFYDCFNMLINLRTDGNITDRAEKYITHLVKWLFKFPYDHTYQEVLNLKEYVLKPTAYGYVHRLPYDEFLDIIKDWSDDEIIEMIGRYRNLRLNEYRRDKRRILFTILEGKIENY